MRFLKRQTSNGASKSRAARTSLFQLYSDIPVSVYWGAGISLIGIFILLWVLITELKLVSHIFLPSPSAIVEELFAQVQSGDLMKDILASVYRILIGWLISTCIALPVGILMGTFKVIEGFFEPFNDLVRYMPAVAFLPLTILWFGVGESQKFVIIFIGTFFQQVIMIMDNVKNVPREFVQISYTLGLHKREILFWVILRSALPAIWDTLRITLGWAWTYLVLAELVAANVGLGYRIMRAQRYLQTQTIILDILIMGVLGLIFDYFFKTTYKLMFPWMMQNH